jgi:hypothetical protein
MKARNLTVVFIGMVLMAASILGVVFVGQIINPPATPMAVAIVEIPAGTVISRDMVRMDNVQVNSKVAASHVREAELDQFVGSVAVEPIHQYSYLSKSALSKENSPAAGRRLALALADPKLVAMVVPVDQKTAPDAIVEGDYIDLDFGALGDRTAGSTLTTRPTEAPGFSQGYSNGLSQLALLPTGTLSPTATPTPEPLLMLPVAKTIVSQAKVMSVVRDTQTATQIDAQGQAQTVATPGKLLALVVAVPREAQELVQFAIDNGSVRVALLSAQIRGGDPALRQPTLGMTWNDLVSLMRMEREAALATATPPSILGPGAYALEATRNAATQAVVSLTQTAAQATQQAGQTQTPGGVFKTPEPTPTATPTAKH